MNDKRIYLAPMVGRTDEYYRALVRIMSKNIYLYTEMITCDAFYIQKENTIRLILEKKTLQFS